jgi:hypothetical protein
MSAQFVINLHRDPTTPTDTSLARELLAFAHSSNPQNAAPSSPVGRVGWEGGEAVAVAVTRGRPVSPAREKSIDILLAAMTTTPTTTAPRSTDTKITKTYNKFSVFFMLERQLFLHTHGKVGNAARVRRGSGNADDSSSSTEVDQYANLDLPPLCSRYANIPLSPDRWFVDLLEANREDELLHSSFAFADTSRFAARRFAMSNYKEVDDVTRSFLNDVSKRLAVFYGREEPPNPSHGTISEENAEREGARLPVGHHAPSPSRLQIPCGNILLPPLPPLPFTYDVDLERLRQELTLAVISYHDSNRRISTLLDDLLERHRLHEQQHRSSLREQRQDRLENEGHLTRQEDNHKEQQRSSYTREKQLQERPVKKHHLDPRDKERMSPPEERPVKKHPLDPRDKERMLPPEKRFRHSRSEDYEAKATVDAPEGHSRHGGSPPDALGWWADHRWKSLPPAARRGINW